MPVIDVRGVTHAYGDGQARRLVLRDVSVTLSEQRVGVIGANGSGKSTFVRLLNGLVLPAEGTVSVHGLDTRKQGREVRRRVGFCFTDPDAQIVMPTVAEDVAFGLRRRGLGKAEVAARVGAGAIPMGGHREEAAFLAPLPIRLASWSCPSLSTMAMDPMTSSASVSRMRSLPVYRGSAPSV